MKNKEAWLPSHYHRDSKNRLKGTHMHKIIGRTYEKVIREHATGLLADIGCGDVPYYSIYKDLVSDNICVDWGQEGRGPLHLDYIVDLNEGIPLENDVFDTVLCTDVLEHIKNPGLVVSEISRIMKKEGKVIITVPFMYWIHDAPYDFHRYTKYMLVEYCNRNKLSTIYIEEYGGLPEVLYDLVFKGYIFGNFPFRRPFLFFWRKTGAFLSRLGFVKRLSKRTRETFPLGYIMVAQKEVLS
ncbi:MAG TPA: class I SAM-dependent methyltransferase [Flavitalea sp.]|nr:class I SAM-dependent methyltransferase [Flavitalea sp.]